MFYRRRLPHWIPEDAIVFLTWRLWGSPPPTDPELLRILEAAQVGQTIGFCRLPNGVKMKADDKSRSSTPPGPRWLEDRRIAEMVVNALLYREKVHEFYDLHAWVIMPTHVHVILQPRTELAAVMRWLKGRTGRVANEILGRTGEAFWQDESFDHWIRSDAELRFLADYVEENPVKAGLVQAAEQWLWSSARRKADDKNRSSAPLG